MESSLYILSGPGSQNLLGGGCKELKKQHLGAGLGILAVLAAVAYVLYRWHRSGFAWDKFVGVLSNVDWSWLSLALALILATYVGRALRWEIMLRPLTTKVHLWRIVVATCIGFTAVVLFGRAGEPVRPYLIARKAGVSFSSQVAAWVVERILDLLPALPVERGIGTALLVAGITIGFAGLFALCYLAALRRVPLFPTEDPLFLKELATRDVKA